MTKLFFSEEESNLGFACNKTCSICNQPVSLDGQDRYLCYECGFLVQAAEDQIETEVLVRIDGGKMVKFSDTKKFADFIVSVAEEIPHDKRFGTTAK